MGTIEVNKKKKLRNVQKAYELIKYKKYKKYFFESLLSNGKKFALLISYLYGWLN